MKHKVKVVMLPTGDIIKNHVVKHFEEGALLTINDNLIGKVVDSQVQIQHLYITVSQDVEPIKEGDWFYNSFNDNQPKIQQRKGNWKQCFNQKKIIATTDPNLRINIGEKQSCGNYHSIPMAQLQQSFLKEFVANPDGEWEAWYTNGGKHSKPILEDNTVIITSVEKKMYNIGELIPKFKLALNKSGLYNDKYTLNWIKENL
tara:strand:+ start:829 stop:1434 length:606 start_codon:yes stop_codon:yes gene_type:complete